MTTLEVREVLDFTQIFRNNVEIPPEVTSYHKNHHRTKTHLQIMKHSTIEIESIDKTHFAARWTNLTQMSLFSFDT